MNSKYIKTKCNLKLETKFFRSFQVLHPLGSQAYKLKLPKRWRIYDIFHISLLEQDTTRKGRVDEKTVEQLKFEASSDNKEYKVEGIYNIAVYAKESEAGYLLGLYYLIFWKDYLEDKSTWELASTVQHLRKFVNTFYKDHPNKPIATFPPIDLAPPMAKRTTLPNINSKWKYSQPVGSMRKKVKY